MCSSSFAVRTRHKKTMSPRAAAMSMSNGLTGTAPARQCKKACWLGYAQALITGLTVREAASYCRAAPTFIGDITFLCDAATHHDVREDGIVEGRFFSRQSKARARCATYLAGGEVRARHAEQGEIRCMYEEEVGLPWHSWPGHIPQNPQLARQLRRSLIIGCLRTVFEIELHVITSEAKCYPQAANA